MSSIAFQIRPLKYEKSVILHLLNQTFSFCCNVLKVIKTKPMNAIFIARNNNKIKEYNLLIGLVLCQNISDEIAF